MSQSKRRRNKQGLERVLAVARLEAQNALGDNDKKCSYFQGVIDALEHALNIREAFRVVETKQVTVQESLAIVTE